MHSKIWLQKVSKWREKKKIDDIDQLEQVEQIESLNILAVKFFEGNITNPKWLCFKFNITNLKWWGFKFKALTVHENKIMQTKIVVDR